jgi:hypothetical protein
VVSGIQDLGAAGLSCAFSELASNGDGGMLARLDEVPLRDPSLRPEEILMSESQERMMAVVRPEDASWYCSACFARFSHLRAITFHLMASASHFCASARQSSVIGRGPHCPGGPAGPARWRRHGPPGT